MGRKKGAYCPRIESVEFIGCGTYEDTTIMLQNIILNHLKKDGIISDKMIYSNPDKVKTVYELQKSNNSRITKETE